MVISAQDNDGLLQAVLNSRGIQDAIPSGWADLRRFVQKQVVDTTSWIKRGSDDASSFDQHVFEALPRSEHSRFVNRHRSRFLAHEPLMFDICPEVLSNGVPVPISAEMYVGRLSVIAIRPKEQSFLLYGYIGRVPLFLYDLLRNTAYMLPQKTYENVPGLLSLLLAHLGSRKITIGTVFAKTPVQEPRYLVISDERPSHFVQETLGFLAKQTPEPLSGFLDQGGRVAIARDRCLVNPVELFPELSGADLLLTTSKSLICNFDFGSSFFHNIYRATDNSVDLEAVFQRFRPATPEAGRSEKFSVFIVLDVEKSRFANQFECLTPLIDRLSALCSGAGRQLDIAFDGWTPSSFNASDQDKEKHRLVCNVAGEIMQGRDAIWQVLSDRPFHLKAREISAFDLALASHGTGALLPCKVLRLPTITFGVRAFTDNYEIDPSCHHRVPQTIVREFAEDSEQLFHRQRFKLDADAFCDFVLGIAAGELSAARDAPAS